MSLSTVTHIIAQVGDAARARKTRRVEFEWSGGEPLLLGSEFYSHVFQLQRESIPASIANTFYTNLLLLDESMANLLASVGADVYTSLDDLSGNALRRGSPSRYFDLFDQRLTLLLDRGLRVKLYMTVTSHNVTALSEVYEYTKQHDVDFDFSNIQTPFTDGESRLKELAPPLREFKHEAVSLFDRWYMDASAKTVVKPFYALLTFLVSGVRPRPTTLPSFDADGVMYACPFDVSKGRAFCGYLQTSGSKLAQIVKQPCNQWLGVHPVCAECSFTDFCNWMLCKDQAEQMRIPSDPALQHTCAYWKPVFEHIRTRVLSDLATK